MNDRLAAPHPQSSRPAACPPSQSGRADLAHCTLAEQSIEFQLGNAVAFAREAFQATAIEDRDVATPVADETGPLQGARRGGDAGPLHPQHHCQEFLREQKLVRLHAVVRHQHPAAGSLLDVMKMIARGGLCDLIEEGVGIAQQRDSHRSALRQFPLEQGCLHAQSGTRNLDVSAGGRLVVAEHQGQTHHALAADRAHLGRLAVRHRVDQGADAGLDEVDKPDGLVGFVERLPVLQRNRLKMREKSLVIRAWQQTEQSVGVRLGSLAARYHLNAPVGHGRTVARRWAGQLPSRSCEQSSAGCVVGRIVGSYVLAPSLAEARSRILHTNRQRKLTLGFAEQLLDAGTRVVVQEKGQHLSITIDVHLDNAGFFRHRGSSHKGTEASATGVPEAGASTQSARRMSGVAADHTSVVRSRWNGKAGMSDIGHKLTWINAVVLPPSLRDTGFRSPGSRKADGMSTELVATGVGSPPPAIFVFNRPQRRPAASYERKLTEIRLQQALAREAALLRERDGLIRNLLAWHDAAIDRIGGLTPRQRQIVELVLAGQRSKNIAAGLGISQRHRRKPSRFDHEEGRREVSSGAGTTGACRCLA